MEKSNLASLVQVLIQEAYKSGCLRSGLSARLRRLVSRMS